MRWIIMSLLLAGCGPSRRQVQRAAVLDAGPTIDFIVARTPIEPALLQCPDAPSGLKPATQRWHAAHLAWTLARTESKRTESKRIDATGHALESARQDALIAYQDAEAMRVTDTPPVCPQPLAFNRALLELAEYEERVGEALSSKKTLPDAGSTRQSLAWAAQPPFTDQAWYLIGTLETQAGRPEAARDAFAKVSPSSPLAPEIALRIAMMRATDGEHEAAIARYAKAVDAQRPLLQSAARYGQARSQFVLGQTTAAVRALIDLAQQDSTRDLGQIAAWLLASDWDGPDDTQGDPSLARLQRFLPSDDPVQHEIMRRAIELWAPDHTDLALAAIDALVKTTPLSSELPGALRARLQILDARDAEAALAARRTLGAQLSPAWFTANDDRPAALRAATALLDASDQAAAKAHIAWKRMGEAAVHLAAWNARRVAPPPAPIKPAADANNPAEVAQQLMMAGHFDAAATVWLSIAETHPKYMSTALFNAMSAQLKADRILEARQTAHRVLDWAPHAPEAVAAARIYASTSEVLFDFETAATAWVAFARRAHDTPEAADALGRAATLNEALGRPKAAAELVERLVAVSPADAPSLLKAAALYAQANAPDKQRAMLERLAGIPTSRTAMLQAQALLADLKTGTARTKAFSALLDRTRVDVRRGLPDATLAAIHAQALFESAEPAFNAFVAPTQWPTEAKLRSPHLAQLQQEFQAIQSQYEAILNLRTLEWSLAAIFRLGGLFTAFANHIDQSPQPRDLPSEARAQFRAMMHNVSAPVRLKAVNAYAAIIKRGAITPASPWVPKARAALCALGQCPNEAPQIGPAPVPTARSMPLFTRLEKADNPKAQAMLTAGIQAVDAGRNEDAELIFERAAALYPDCVEAELNGVLLQQWRGETGRLALGRARRMGRLPNAVSMVETLGRWRAGTLDSTASLAEDAQIRMALRGQTAGARTAAKSRFEAVPTHRFARLNRLRAALQTRPALAQVVSDWSWVRRDPLALDLVAEALMQTGQMRPAGALLRGATQLPGGAHAEAYARLATVYMTVGRDDAARAALEKALARQPDLAAARANLTQITNRTPVAK